jgi:hypothetical protein
MTSHGAEFEKVGVRIPEILLPVAGTDYGKWAVVACDQYSSERDYWEQVRTAVGDEPSTLNLIFPEAYLEDEDETERIDRIQATMRDYLARGVLESRGAGFVLVERKTPFEKEPRKGLVIAVDLEKYMYGRDSKSPIRPTEGTIVERLPPRMRIRRGAPLELPHIMLLIDDPGRSVIEPIYARREGLPRLYDFELMMGSGRARGWRVADETSLGSIASALERLADPKAFESKYGSREVLLFAVGDGNHSLATAKAIWEETKKERARDPLLMTHPARWALVELVNIYDEGLPFHPIHRVLFGADEAGFLRAVGAYQKCRITRVPSAREAFAEVDGPDTSGAHRVAFVSPSGAGVIAFPEPAARLATGTIQPFLDGYLKSGNATGIDYIHGEESLVALATKKGNLCLYLPPIDKGGFFGTVVRDGVMPRKTFSMGEAPEKRFYVEARKIVL